MTALFVFLNESTQDSVMLAVNYHTGRFSGRGGLLVGVGRGLCGVFLQGCPVLFLAGFSWVGLGLVRDLTWLGLAFCSFFPSINLPGFDQPEEAVVFGILCHDGVEAHHDVRILRG